MKAVIEVLSDFLNSKPVCVEDAPNPFIYGQPWAIGNSYSKAQKQAFTERWQKFATSHPDIWALLPLRDVQEKNT